METSLTHINRRQWLALALASSTLPAAQAQTGSTPVRVIVPYAAGGISDAAARVIVDRLGHQLGQPAIVENRGGAGSRIGTQAVMQSPADGMTLLFTNVSLSTLPLVDRSLHLDPVKDLAPASIVAVYGVPLVIRPTLPVKSLAELIDYAKRNPGKLSYGSAGPGSGSHFAMEYFKHLTGTHIVHIPYRSTSAALNDVAAGQIDIAIDASAKALIDAGRVRALAILGAQRDPRLPSLPTAGELGFKGLDFNSWLGFLAPQATPRDAIERLNKAINAVLQEPEVKRQIEGLGLTPASGPPARLTQQLQQDADFYRKVIREAGLRFEAS